MVFSFYPLVTIRTDHSRPPNTRDDPSCKRRAWVMDISCWYVRVKEGNQTSGVSSSYRRGQNRCIQETESHNIVRSWSSFLLEWRCTFFVLFRHCVVVNRWQKTTPTVQFSAGLIQSKWAEGPSYRKVRKVEKGRLVIWGTSANVSSGGCRGQGSNQAVKVLTKDLCYFNR